ncbi:MAG: alcohol dehydrogenase catalytic domain-containing protein [Desulfobacterales bacterium]|nr:alcohol dehydrogenase catalytic domain-containing protein [Desulfobacterales bacterium]
METNGDADGSLAEGDLVQIWPGIACGTCRPCRKGGDNRCPDIKIMGFNTQGRICRAVGTAGREPGAWMQPSARKRRLLSSGPLPSLWPAVMNGQEPLPASAGMTIVLILRRRPHRRSCMPSWPSLTGRREGDGSREAAGQDPSRCRKSTPALVVFDPIWRSQLPGSSWPREIGRARRADVILSATPELPGWTSDLLQSARSRRKSLHLLRAGSGKLPESRWTCARIHYHEHHHHPGPTAAPAAKIDRAVEPT